MLKSDASYEDQTFKSLSSKSLKKSTFTDIIFESCHFIESDWQQARFIGCRFKNCNLSLVKLHACRLQDIVFEECKIVGLDFFKCEKTLHLSFNKCIMQTCNFTDLKLKGTSFAGSKIKEVYFTHTDLSETNFTDTDLLGTIFHQCNLTKSDFRNAKNYLIDLQTNNAQKAQFSFPEAINLLQSFDITIT
jgi:fluoroquinolone resistance protein